MGAKLLTQEQKNKILDMVLNTRMTYKLIARKNNIDAIQLNQIIDEYCRENNYKSFRRIEKGIIFEKEDGTVVEFARIEQIETEKQSDKKVREQTLENIEDIQKWADKNGRKPRSAIKGVKIVKKGEKETKEQEELRMGTALNNTRRIAYKYKGKKLQEIEDETDREIVKIYRELEETYKDRRKARKRILKKLQGIECWADNKRRKPRTTIKGVKLAKEGEVETEEQEELRLGMTLNNARRIVNKYEGKELEEIEDEDDKSIVRIVRTLDAKYEKNEGWKKKKTSGRKLNFVQTLGNEKMGKMIINLIKTKNATQEQVKTIAEFYGVDLEKIVNSKEER